MMPVTLQEKYDHAVEAMNILIASNASLTAERERARDTASLLEQSLAKCEDELRESEDQLIQLRTDLKDGAHLDGFALDLVKEAQQDREVALEEIEKWKRLYDAAVSDSPVERLAELEKLNSEYDDKLIAAELEADELRRVLNDTTGTVAPDPVETVADLTLDHLGALVRVWIEGDFSITDRLAAIRFERRRDDIVTAKVVFETAGTGVAAGGYVVDLHHPVAILESACQGVPF